MPAVAQRPHHLPAGLLGIGAGLLQYLLQFLTAMTIETRYENRLLRLLVLDHLVSAGVLGDLHVHHADRGAARVLQGPWPPRRVGFFRPGFPMTVKSDYSQYLITESSSVSWLIRLRDVVLTVALWIIYLYFIRASWPFIVDLFHWAMNGFNDMADYPNLKIVPTIQAYGQVALVMTTVYLGWAIYNMLRFRGRERRKPRAGVMPVDLANMYGFSTETVEAWQNARGLIMHHDAEGHLTDVRVGE